MSDSDSDVYLHTDALLGPQQACENSEEEAREHVLSAEQNEASLAQGTSGREALHLSAECILEKPYDRAGHGTVLHEEDSVDTEEELITHHTKVKGHRKVKSRRSVRAKVVRRGVGGYEEVRSEEEHDSSQADIPATPTSTASLAEEHSPPHGTGHISTQQDNKAAEPKVPTGDHFMLHYILDRKLKVGYFKICAF